MANFEITVRNVSNTDTKIIASLHKITGQSLSGIKEKISRGLPIFSGVVSFADCYDKDGILERLVDYFQENNIDAIIRQDDKTESLNEFLKGWSETRTRIRDGFDDYDDERIKALEKIIEDLQESVENLESRVGDLESQIDGDGDTGGVPEKK